MPHVVCRRCKFRMDLLTVIDDDRARAALAAALKLPHQVSDVIQGYMTLFETDSRGLTWARYGAILTALLEDLGRGLVVWKKATRPAPLALWVECMQAMTAMEELSLPLKNHHYLRAMVFRKAEAAEALAEAQREEQRRLNPAQARQEAHGTVVPTVQRDGAPKSVAEHLAALAPGLRRPSSGS
jgi:nucleotide-binding universal stress UspA family protein